MTKYKIFVDSASDLTNDMLAKYNIGLWPFIMNIDGIEYRTSVDITTEEFYEKQKTVKSFPSTTQITPNVFMAYFEDVKNDGYDGIIYYPISSAGSGTYQSANLAKNMFLEKNPSFKIEIVDTLGFSLLIGIVAIEAAKRIMAGEENIEIIAKDTKKLSDKMEALFVVDTLKYLEMGGRINKAAMFFGTMLDIKPVLSVVNGLIESVDKFRGTKNIIGKLVKKVSQKEIDIDNFKFSIAHANCPEKAIEAKLKLQEIYGENCVDIVCEIGTVIGLHAGPGAVAIFFKNK